VNVIAADSAADAKEQFLTAKRRRVSQLFGRGQRFTDDEADMILEAPAGRQVLQMAKYSAVGTPPEVKDYLDWFAEHAQADELIVATQARDTEAWLRSFELLANVSAPAAA